jgi:uncharacterized protein (TIGR02001 family)
LASAIAAALVAASQGSAARAQVAGSLAIESDYRVRGYSLSEGRPAATAQFGYDSVTGLYANAAATFYFDRGDPRWLGSQVNIGYSRRLGPDLSLDAGLARSDYRGEDAGPARNYTEAYVGLATRRLTARLFYSPDYYRDHVSALYAEAEAGFEPADEWRISGHVGALAYLGSARPFAGRRDLLFDWRASLGRTFGAAEIHAAVSGGSPRHEYYRGRERDRTGITVGASWAF